jgi:imidazolonepropionase-like amidohydrolase
MKEGLRMRRRFFARSAMVTTICLCAAAPITSQEVFLQGGSVVDPAAREIRVQNLLLRDGRIVDTPSDVPAGFSGEVVDVSGRWIIPGLVDLHTHSFGNQAPGANASEFLGTPVVARRMLYAGVTAFLDLFGLEDQIFFVRNTQRENHTPGADIFAAGPCITAPAGHCSEYGIPTRLISTPEEAREQVTELAAKDPDVVKIVYSPTGRMPSVDRATMTAAVETATEFGLTTIIHVDDWEDVRHAAEAGASAVTHIPSGPVPEDVIALMVERGVASIPTMAVQTGVADLTNHPDWLDTPFIQAFAGDAVLDAYRAEALPENVERWRTSQIADRADLNESVRRLHDAGVTVLTGTDSGNYGTIQGWSMHHELQQLVAAGLSTWDALAAGTTDAGAFLGLEYGVTVGSLGNLVVLDASPVDDIAATRQIVLVVHRGAVVERTLPVSRP